MSMANAAAVAVRLQLLSRHGAARFLSKMGVETHRDNRRCKRIWEESDSCLRIDSSLRRSRSFEFS
jgi:hypothetical protein